jgi:hypothetical protein
MERISAATNGATSTNWASNNLITRNGKDAAGNNINGTPKAENSVSISPTTISSLPFNEFSEITLSYYGSPYIINSSLEIPVNATLSIEPKVKLKFATTTNLNVLGTIKAISLTISPIVFTSQNGVWKGIKFASSSQNSVLDNCQIENTGGGEEAIEILGSSPTIKNSKFFNHDYGIFIKEGSRAEIIGNYFEDTGKFSPSNYSIYVNQSYPVLKQNMASSSEMSGVLLFGTFSENWKLYKNNENFPYIVEYAYFAGDLEIEPGTTIKLKEHGRLEIHGALKAEGTDGEKILFTTLTGNNWGYINFYSDSQNSTLKNVVLDNVETFVNTTTVAFQKAEFKNAPWLLHLENSSSTVENCLFENSQYEALTISGGSPYIASSTFATTTLAVRIKDGSQALIENNDFGNFKIVIEKNSHPIIRENSGTNAIYISAISLAQDWTLYKNSNMFYVVSGYLQVNSGKTLEIKPGITIKIPPPGSRGGFTGMIIYGALKAIGEESERIVITSTEENKWWKGIHFASSTGTSTLKYIEIDRASGWISYLSGENRKGAIYIVGSKVEISNASFTNHFYYFIYFENSPQSSLSNSQFDTASSSAIKIEGESPLIQWETLSFP